MRICLAILLLGTPVFAQTCTYTLLPSTLSLPSSASTGYITINTATNCSWSASITFPANTIPWLTIDAILGTGSGALNYTSQANVTGVQRTATITVAGTAIPVTQAAPQCSYTLTPKSENFPVGGGKDTFKVSTGCIWQPVSNNGNFITVSDPNTVRTGDAAVAFSVGPNACVAGRSGSITINTNTPGQAPAFTITQDGSPSNLSFSPASASAGPEASDGRVSVITGAGCGWSARSDVTWMQITNGSSGSGNGGISYHLLANNTAVRSGNIIVGNVSYTVTQAASGGAGPALSSVTSAANYAKDAVSPGEIVTLFGAGMGPSKLVTMDVSGGSVASFLAGTQVLFDGNPAAIIYTSDKQVSAVVPYGVNGKSSTNVQVIYNGLFSNTVAMTVQSAHPAILTLDSSGLGPGAILNQDYTINSSANPASRGSVVLIYATGGGTTSPALADGAVTGTPLPYLTQNAFVTIGGIEAPAQYAGGAPGSVAGLTQINAVVPAGVTPGSTVPVTIRIGTYTSSPGVTLSVR